MNAFEIPLLKSEGIKFTKLKPISAVLNHRSSIKHFFFQHF